MLLLFESLVMKMACSAARCHHEMPLELVVPLPAQKRLKGKYGYENIYLSDTTNGCDIHAACCAKRKIVVVVVSPASFQSQSLSVIRRQSGMSAGQLLPFCRSTTLIRTAIGAADRGDAVACNYA